jgi:SAM-dependent methyltransferase
MHSCVSCGRDLRVFRRYDFKSAAFRHVYRDRHVYRCVECGLCQAAVSQVDEQALLHYYRAEYRAFARIGIGDAGHSWYRARAAALAELAAEQLSQTPARAFEVGAGYGYNLMTLGERFPGVSLFTDELDESIRLPDVIKRGTMSDGNFDVVILSHVLEHFTDPKRLIRSALNALTRDGIVVIEVPNDVPGIFPLNGPDEPHLTFFTAQTLATLLGTSAVFAAGPPYRNKSVGAHVRRIAATVLQDTPVVSRFLKHGRMRVISPSSFAMRRQNGVFLRAVLRNPQKTVGKDRKTPQAHAAAPAQA